MAIYVWRTLVILHRYLGVAVGLLMLIWFGPAWNRHQPAEVRFSRSKTLVDALLR
jgi:hypothetical protein